MKLNLKKAMILFVSILGLSGCEALNAYYQGISSRSPLARFNSYRLYQFAGSTYAAYDNDSRVSYDFNQTAIQDVAFRIAWESKGMARNICTNLNSNPNFYRKKSEKECDDLKYLALGETSKKMEKDM